MQIGGDDRLGNGFVQDKEKLRKLAEAHLCVQNGKLFEARGRDIVWVLYCECDGSQTFSCIGVVFKGYKLFRVISNLINAILNDVCDDVLISSYLLLQAVDEGVSNAALS